jgi:antitoxin CptB
MSDPEMSRLRWRCRRGMKELDMLLLDYVDRHYVEVGPVGQKAFRQLLSMPDPDILALLTGKATTDDEHLANVIKRLLTRD